MEGLQTSFRGIVMHMLTDLPIGLLVVAVGLFIIGFNRLRKKYLDGWVIWIFTFSATAGMIALYSILSELLNIS